jgi:hypothetical protein
LRSHPCLELKRDLKNTRLRHSGYTGEGYRSRGASPWSRPFSTH